jgi:PAS domain S-box-containing protein
LAAEPGDHVTTMSNSEFQLRGFSDARLALHATSALPAWLWSVDGTRILWSNPVGASMFGAANSTALAKKIFGPADARRRQVARLAHRLPPAGAVRLERLRGFGAQFGGLVSCGCARLDFADGSHGILIAAAESAGSRMPLAERLRRLIEGIEMPIAAFAPDGELIGASHAARPLLFRRLSEAGLESQRSDALKQGRVEAPIGAGRMVLQRVGAGGDVGLIALIEPGPAQAEPVAPAADRPTPDYELPANSGEAPAEFALIDEFSTSPPAQQTGSAENARSGPAAELPIARHIPLSNAHDSPHPIAIETSPPTDLETVVETTKETTEEPPKNVLPFRPLGEPKSPVLTPVENSAFNELARQLSARLDSEEGASAAPPASDASDAVVEQPGWLAQPEPPALGDSRRDKTLLDLLPAGILIYRLDRLVYANPAFLDRLGYPNLHALEDAGGLDALYVEPGVSTASSTSDTGTPVTISASQASPEHAAPSATEARLYTISWDGDSALALIFSGAPAQTASAATAISETIPAAAPSAVGHANAEELGAILDTTAEGIVMFDAEGNINSCNRSAEALFGYDGSELVQRNLAELFAPESQRVVRDYLESTKESGVASLLDHGRDVLGRASRGGIIPLSMTMGRTQAHGPNFFAVFRDLSQVRKSESELQQARRQADRAANAKADMLARISHEVRTPLNAIIGFAEVMIGERFGTLGNERYFEYMHDIRASGEHVIAIINDLLDLSRIETGKLDLAFANQNLNDLVEQCVAVMQRQANRERIIIRTSLARMLPAVVADAHALRQIALNLIGNSIHLANAGGQVIVSTALSDFGDVVLRVRDTGHGLNDNEIAAAMEPFRTQAPSDRASPGVSLSLTKALVEANRAQFHIKSGSHPGTLIEVVFSHAMAKA